VNKLSGLSDVITTWLTHHPAPFVMSLSNHSVFSYLILRAIDKLKVQGEQSFVRLMDR
jgi:hypothetical protein